MLLNLFFSGLLPTYLSSLVHCLYRKKLSFPSALLSSWPGPPEHGTMSQKKAVARPFIYYQFYTTWESPWENDAQEVNSEYFNGKCGEKWRIIEKWTAWDGHMWSVVDRKQQQDVLGLFQASCRQGCTFPPGTCRTSHVKIYHLQRKVSWSFLNIIFLKFLQHKIFNMSRCYISA